MDALIFRNAQHLFCLFLLSALAACSGIGGGGPVSPVGGTPAPVPAPTIADPLAYLVEGVTPGDASNPLRAGDAMTYRRQDFGGYQDEDAYLLADGMAVLDWSYPPFGPFVAANGDGGESYAVSGDAVSITATQDGGKPGVQTFNGWVAFKTDAAATPQCFVAPIKAYTCYSRQTVTFPKIGAVDTIVSDHYSTRNPASAPAMERSFWGLGWGRVAWQAWTRGGAPVDPARCPDFGWNQPPRPGLVLSDCRENVTVVPQTTPLDPAQLWHP